MSDPLLEQARRILGLVDGCLLPASTAPTEESVEHWTDKGDWLALAKEVGAREVFFVESEPVIVLAELPQGEDERSFFNRIWSMSRPQMLFLARPGELSVYKLDAPPARVGEPLSSGDRLFDTARSVQEIQSKLAVLRRERIETGEVYGDERFGNGSNRADRALVQDFKALRRLLTEGESRLDPPIAHALIGRALFVRYLEDRKILIPEYFEEVARARPAWRALLAREPVEVFAEARAKDVLFFRVLEDKELTYVLFEHLARDFNGDTLPVTPEELGAVKPHHLRLLRGMLMGDDDAAQRRLFFFAYRFDIVPIELISSIYEDFYAAKQGKGNTQSSYYTPPSLVDFLLSRVLTKEVLDDRPRVTDAACGSGIFLVETFRRMVRHRSARQRRRLSQKELRVILRDQIRGIDLNPEAIPVAAFSLYLAYLHYQKPREINEHRRLPNLRFTPGRTERDPDQHFDTLFTGNAFEAIAHQDPVARKHFGPGSAEIVVGNPPWGDTKGEDSLGRAAMPQTTAWCHEAPERIVGDKEMSQAFIHLALELLADGGTAALLLSSGVLFKQHDVSRRFRASWLRRCKLVHVVNFAHVRHLYFSDPARPRALPDRKPQTMKRLRESDGAAPFISTVFVKGSPPPDHRFAYWAARRSVQVEKTRAVVVSHADMHRLNQDECLRYDSRWKIYWWGGRRDEELIRDMERFPGLASIHEDDAEKQALSAVGYVAGKNGRKPSGWLQEFKELKAKDLKRYGALPEDRLVRPPSLVRRKGSREVYEGRRLLMTRGIGAEQGRLDVRLATEPFCFTHSIIGYRLSGLEDWEAACVVGMFWSSLTRYYLWLTSGSWGFWHDETLPGTADRVPIAFPRDKALRRRIVQIVSELQNIDPSKNARIKELEGALDEAMFDLYELSEADRDLVRDMCTYGLDFFYNRSKSHAVRPAAPPRILHGLARDLPRDDTDGLTGYLQVFLRQWNTDLAPDGELAWELVTGTRDAPVVAALFSTVAPGERPEPSASGDRAGGWQQLLRRFSEHSLVPAEVHRTIYTDTFVRTVSEHEILIIKRNEARFWTRSAALEDADATLAQAMTLADRES